MCRNWICFGRYTIVSHRETNETLIFHIPSIYKHFFHFQTCMIKVRISSNWKICWKTHQRLSVIFLCQALTVWFWHSAGELPVRFITAGLRLAKYLRLMFRIWREGDVDKIRGNPIPMKWPGSGIPAGLERPLRFHSAYISHTGLQELIAWD